MAAPNSTADAPQSESLTRLNLGPEQKKQVATAACEMLHSLVAGGPAVFPTQHSELGKMPVSGVFVSLKRGRHLRGCCGMLGQPATLAQALAHAAERTIWEDERFPPVSASELTHLTLEVWLLFNPQIVQAHGAERTQGIVIGKHGVQVVNGPARGLFLPSVAVDSHWDALTLLDRVCQKAGLPPTAWREDSTTLSTFEGEVLESPLAGIHGKDSPSPNPPCRFEDLPTLADLCRANLGDLLRGAAPRYFAGAPDGTVAGAVVTVQRPGDNESRSFSRISLRPGLAIQATLFGLIQTAANHCSRRGWNPQAVDELAVGLTLLFDPVFHGTVADPQLAGFDHRSRALLVLERAKSGLAFDVHSPGGELLKQAAEHARVSQAAGAAVYSLAALTNVPRVAIAAGPRPVRGPALRPAAVAGKFYAAEPARLSDTVDQLLAGERRQENWRAAMVPHAGLQFSGRIAADVLRRIALPQTAIVIGPNHTGKGMEWAVAPHQTWAMPGFEVASDFALARKLCQAIPGLEMDAAAHQHEHAIEVELPLLARLAPEIKVVGISIGHGDLESCQRFAQGLAELLRKSAQPPLLVISSDMNHFATDAENRRLDGLALAALERCDPAELYRTVARNNISMCGVLPAVIVLETLRILGQLTKAERTGYATSADVTGDKSRVVGYAGMLFG